MKRYVDSKNLPFAAVDKSMSCNLVDPATSVKCELQAVKEQLKEAKRKLKAQHERSQVGGETEQLHIQLEKREDVKTVIIEVDSHKTQLAESEPKVNNLFQEIKLHLQTIDKIEIDKLLQAHKIKMDEENYQRLQEETTKLVERERQNNSDQKKRIDNL